MSILEEHILKKEAEYKKKGKKNTWVQNMIENMHQCRVATHVGKFTHPDSQIAIKVISGQNPISEYVTTMSVRCMNDVVYNDAKYSGIARFLNLVLENNDTVLNQAESGNQHIREIIEKYGGDYELFKKKLKCVKNQSEPKETEAILKQVYFPVGYDDYHLLSVLPNSSVLYELSERVRLMSINRSKVMSLPESGEYQDILGGITIGFGGTQSQNISELNIKNKGNFFLLESLPPTITKKRRKYPKRDFWKEAVTYYDILNNIREIHALIKDTRNNKHIRKKIRRILYQVVDKVFQIKYELWLKMPRWVEHEVYKSLKEEQKIWLNLESTEILDEEMRDVLSVDFARWLLQSYEQVIKKDKVLMGKAELHYISKFMRRALRKGW